MSLQIPGECGPVFPESDAPDVSPDVAWTGPSNAAAVLYA